MAKAATEYKWPKTIGALIDRAYALRESRLELSKKVEVIKKEESAIASHLIDTISKDRLQGAKGKVAQFSFKHVQIPTIEDFESVCKWQVSKGGVLILQRRLNTATVQEIWDEGKQVPGVGVFDDLKTSLTKI